MDLSDDNPSMDLAKKRKLEENSVVYPPEPPATTTTTLSHDDLRKVIETLSHEQLSQIVLFASLRHPDVLESVRSTADRDPTQRNLYIRGLGRETTSETLRNFFSTYGDLVEASAVIDKATGKGKGFGFIMFKHIDGALRALKEPTKLIDGNTTVTQLASTGFRNEIAVQAGRRVYVGNVSPEMPRERLLAHFSSYGEVEEGPVGFDITTGKFKGFAFITYKKVEGASACLLDPIKTVDGHVLHCRLASSKKGNHASVAAAPSAAATLPKVKVQVQGSADAVKPEVVNSYQPCSTQGSFGGGGPNGGGYGGSHFGSPGSSNGGTHSGGGTAAGTGLGGPGDGGPGSEGRGWLGIGYGGPGATDGGSGSGGRGWLGTSFGGPGASDGGPGGVGRGLLGIGFGGPGATDGGPGSGVQGWLGTGSDTSQRLHYGLSRRSMRMNSGGYRESAHYSLSSGSVDQTQEQPKKYLLSLTPYK